MGTNQLIAPIIEFGESIIFTPKSGGIFTEEGYGTTVFRRVN